MNFTRLKLVSAALLALVTLAIIIVVIWMFQLDGQIQSQIQGGWFRPPVEFYSAPEKLRRGMKAPVAELVTKLKSFEYRERSADQKLLPGDFARLDVFQCQQNLSEELPEGTFECLVYHGMERAFGPDREPLMKLIALDVDSRITGMYWGQPLVRALELTLEPILFAQFYGDQPVLRDIVQIGEVPLYCLQAVTAIEDSKFLEHSGVSLTGIFRAALRNFSQGRFAEGGSTITQQLVKNYFLTAEKTLQRKLTEMLMAVLLEARVDKDQILQSYLNVIYMGQNGPFQIRGFGAASDHFFGKPLGDLNLSECALLAAIINSPGRYNPFRNPENAKTRRGLVLERMASLGMIDDESRKVAENRDLPGRPPKLLSEPAPYFVQAIRKRLGELEVPEDKGLRVFTSMDVTAQEVAQTLVSREVARLENEVKRLKELKEKGKNLQASLVAVDLLNNEIIAMVGGREYRQTQFNRVMDSHRQVGSVMKPFVYLAALESTTNEGMPYSPLTAIDDSRFVHKYEGQAWSPKNYDGKFNGMIPMFYALKSSLNSATAQLGLTIGLESVIDVARRMGIESRIEPLPSMTLGAFELYPWEVAQGYSTIARMGLYRRNQWIRSIETLEGKVLYQEERESEQRAAPETVALLVGMMKQTIETGTARSVRWRGFPYPAAGKTGTTSDNKDAWFAGFTPHVLAITWVGYDDNTVHGLTGSSGAVPMWTQFMKAYATRYPADDFHWPEGTEAYQIPQEQLLDTLPTGEEVPEDGIQLILRQGEI